MKAKLIKVLEHYHLYDGDKAIATTIVGNPMLLPNLSLKNCQAIERGYDLDELAYEYCTHEPKNTKELRDVNLVKLGFRDGFQKALEILGDKKFNEEDMQRAMNWIMTQYFEFHEQPTIGRREHYIQSIQQTEWDCIVEMECCGNYYPPCNVNCEYGPKPKLDADGCLILKRK